MFLLSLPVLQGVPGNCTCLILPSLVAYKTLFLVPKQQIKQVLFNCLHLFRCSVWPSLMNKIKQNWFHTLIPNIKLVWTDLIFWSIFKGICIPTKSLPKSFTSEIAFSLPHSIVSRLRSQRKEEQNANKIVFDHWNQCGTSPPLFLLSVCSRIFHYFSFLWSKGTYKLPAKISLAVVTFC